MFWIKTDDFEVVCYNLAFELFNYDQPIPPFTTRYLGTLESSLSTPLQQIGKKYLYPTFVDKLSVLFYLMIKNHPFLNGNKRLAMTTILVILFGNKKWLNVRPVAIYKLAVDISSSKPKEKDLIIKRIRVFLDKNIVNL